MGIIPYAQKWDQTHSIAQVQEFDHNIFRHSEDIMSWPKTEVSIAGRLMLQRVSGRLSFWQIKDESGTIQIMIEHQLSKLTSTNQINVNDDTIQDYRNEFIWESTKSFDYLFFTKMIDVGDYLGVKGEVFLTHKWELTIFVSEYQLLSKAIRPLGDKFHGIGDDNKEKAYRQRYLDMIFNDESLNRFKLKSKFIRTLREFYWSEGFLEIETPILWNHASWAAAKPFVTYHEDFDTDMFLRIAPETALKMATVGWLEKVFEIGKNFRNEWSSPSHHQEFLVAEHYHSYWNYQDNMAFTERMFNYLFDNIPELKRTIQVADKQWNIKTITFWQTRDRIDYTAKILEDSGIDVSIYNAEDEEKLRAEIKAKWHTRAWLELQTTATMIDYLYKKVTRPYILWPAFIYNYPKTMQPLARTSDSQPHIVEQFQAIVNGWEILKAYSELVDPQEIQENFDAQTDALTRGDDEATKSDAEFVLAMEYGMPPQSGWGMGLDRIFAMLTEQENVRDVIMFPMTKQSDKNQE